MAQKPEKSLVLAYVFWFFAGGLSAHRFYLGNVLGAVKQLVLAAIGWLVLFFGLSTEQENVIIGGLILLACWTTWILLDAVMMPGMAEEASKEPESERQSMAYADVDLDPSPLAMQRKLGVEPKDNTKKSGIPDGYELPWRKEAREKAGAGQQFAEDTAHWQHDTEPMTERRG